MAAAIAAAAALGTAGAIAQYYQSEKARKANQERLDQIEAMYNKIVPPSYDMSIENPPEMIDRTIPPSAYDMTKITPKDFAMIGKFSPQAAAQIAEQKPELLKETATTKEGKDAQRSALQELRNRASGKSVQLQASLDKAARSGQVAAQSRQQSILQDAARRGQAGSGMTLAAQLQGGSDAMERASNEGTQGAIEADRQALQSLKDSASLGGQMSQQDLSQQQVNADIINSFNQRTTAAAQQWANNKANMENQAQLRNLDVGQDIANRNTAQGNEAEWRNRQMSNDLIGKQRQEEVGERGYQNQRYQQRDAQKQYLNQMKGQQYNDSFQKANAMNGINTQQMNQTTGAAQDKNRAIQGVTDSAMAYGNYAGAQSDKEADRKARAKQYGYEYEE